MKRLALILFVVLLGSFAHGQSTGGGQGGGSGSSCITTVANLTGVCGATKGKLATVTDGSTTSDCAVGGGSNAVACLYNGAAWVFAGNAGSNPTFAQVGAGTNATALLIGNGGTLGTTGTGTITSTNIQTGAGLAPTVDGVLGVNTTTHLPVYGSNGSTLNWPANTTATSHQFFSAYNNLTGAFTKAQPVCGDLSDSTALCTTTPATGVATFLITPTSANLAAAMTDETGTGANVFANSPVLITPNLGTPSTLVLTNATGLPFSTGLTGSLSLTQMATQAANTMVGNATAGVAAPTAIGAPSGGTNGCSGAADTAIWTNGTGWGCHQISGSGTVSTGTATQVAFYSASTNAVSGDTLLTDNGTTLSYTGTGGLSTAQMQTTSVSKSGYEALAGNTANNSVIANTAGFMGPTLATFTAYALQLPSTAPSGSQVLQCGTPTSSVSACSFATLSGSGTVTVVASGSLTSTALVTGGGTTTLQTPSATSTLDSSGNLSLAAGGSLKSANTGTPGFTFSTNSVSVNQPLSHALTTNQEVFGTTTNLTTVNYPASSGAVTLTMPNVSTTIPGLGVANTWTALQTFGANASIAGTAHGVLLSQNTSAATATAVGATNTVLHGNTGADPTFSAVTGSDMSNNTVTATQLAAQYAKGSCTEVWGGSGTSFALTSGDDAISNNSCYNDSGVTRTITAVKCRSDNASNTTTVNPTFGSAGTGTTILSGALTCGSSLAYSSTGTVSNASWTTGTGINPVMGGTLTGTSIAVIVEYTY